MVLLLLEIDAIAVLAVVLVAAAACNIACIVGSVVLAGA